MGKAGVIAAMAVWACVGGPVAAQVRTVDPNQAIDADLPPAPARPNRAPAPRATVQPLQDDTPRPYQEPNTPSPDGDAPVPADGSSRPPIPGRTSEPAGERRADATRGADATFHRDDLIGAGEGVFGKGAQGFAGLIEKILKDQGEPNAYIAGREASGAIVVGLRYGSGIMTHRVEGQMPVYWTGPSVGFDLGGDANKVFVLVYNLYDSAQLYHRFPQAEGRLYAVGGFSASYLRWGHVVVIPVRLGVGWRAGVNVGYMKFSRKSKWLPF